jgi:hypothetical protein
MAIELGIVLRPNSTHIVVLALDAGRSSNPLRTDFK